jgi:exopolysaccharide biosynthesis polyprenyl glycosylphosphotransferase
VFTRHRRKVQIYYSLADFLLLPLAFRLAYLTRRELPLERYFEIAEPTQVLILFCAVLTWILSGLWFNLYDRLDSSRLRVLLFRTFRQVSMTALAVVVFEFLMRLDLSRPFLALFFLYAFVLVAVFRSAAAVLAPRLRNGLASASYVLIVGTGERARRLGLLVEEAADYGIRLQGFLDDKAGSLDLGHSYPVYPLTDLPALLQHHVIDEILLGVESERLPQLEELLLVCEEEGVQTRLSLDFFPHLHSRVYLDLLGGAPLLTFARTPHDEARLLIKRATDVLVSAAALLVLAPFFLLIGVVIKLTSRGPVFFGQQRCGLNGRRFTMYKLRTMVANAEALRKDLEHLNVKTTAFKVPNDPRVTPFGRFLRKFSIDEWPQLWNVLRGQMSIVGPRPPIPSEVEQYKRWQRRRLRMRPGLTCLWTLAGRDGLDFDEWMKLDLAYIDSWSLALDWSIMLRTIPHVVTGKGAH